MMKEDIVAFLTNEQKFKLIHYLIDSMRKNRTPIKAIEFRDPGVIIRSTANETDELIFRNETDELRVLKK